MAGPGRLAKVCYCAIITRAAWAAAFPRKSPMPSIIQQPVLRSPHHDLLLRVDAQLHLNGEFFVFQSTQQSTVLVGSRFGYNWGSIGAASCGSYRPPILGGPKNSSADSPYGSKPSQVRHENHRAVGGGVIPVYRKPDGMDKLRSGRFRSFVRAIKSDTVCHGLSAASPTTIVRGLELRFGKAESRCPGC